MKNSVISLAILAFTLSACNDKGVTAPAVQPQAGRGYTLSLKTTCDTGDQCVAAYGFAVSADGSYRVGPDAHGYKLTGKVTAEEQNALESALTSARQSSETVSETCVGNETVQGNSTVTFTSASEQTLIRVAGLDFCYRAKSVATAAALYKEITLLADKYYARPFGNDCGRAVIDASKEYASVQGCSTDADCGYVGSSFEPISTGSIQWVTLTNCSILKPLAVANISLLLKNQDKVVSGLENAQKVCGQEFTNWSCTHVTGFGSTDAAPVCQQGACRVNPSITF